MDIQGILSIDKIIVHILNRENNSDRLILSDVETIGEGKLNCLLIKHIMEITRSDKRLFAKFNDYENNNTAKQYCINMLNNDNNFIDNSKNIARKLFQSMKGTNASSANFVVVKFSDNTSKYIALLKLNFSDNFHTNEIINSNGKTEVRVEVTAGFNTKQKVEKCAIIKQSDLYSLDDNFLLLDKQDREDVSDYFAYGFLECELINDSKKNTKEMIKAFVDFINEKYEKYPEQQLAKTFEVATYFQENTQFELNEALQFIFLNESEKEEFRNKIINKEIDGSFQINEKKVNSRLKSRTVSTDSGFSIKGNATLFNTANIQFIPNKDDKSKGSILIKDVKIDSNKL